MNNIRAFHIQFLYYLIIIVVAAVVVAYVLRLHELRLGLVGEVEILFLLKLTYFLFLLF